MRRILSASLAVLTAFLMLAASATSARAGTIYSDFGSGYSFNTTNGWDVDPVQIIAEAFTPSSDFTLTQIDIALSFDNAFSGTNGATVELVNDANGSPGSTVLEYWDLTNLPDSSTSFTPETLTSSSNPTLSSGTQYWVEVFPADLTTYYDVWNWNNQGQTGVAYSTDSGVTWTFDSAATASAFDVLGTPVPEASTVLLLAMGLLSLLGFARLRKTIPNPEVGRHKDR